MMRKLLPLLIVLVLLIMVAFLLEFPRRKGVSRSEAVLALESESVASFRIAQGSSGVTLAKSEQDWLVRGADRVYPADTGRIHAALEAARQMTGEIVSVNPGNQEVFGVDEAGGTKVELRGLKDSLLASVIIGKPDRDFAATYVRRSISNDVYSIPGFLKSQFRTDLDYWRRRAILSFSQSDLDTLRILYPKASLTFARGADGSMILVQPDSAPFDTSSLEEALRTLTSLSASGFADDKSSEESGLQSPLARFVLVMKSGAGDTLLVGGLKDKTYYVGKAGDPITYLVPKGVTERFLKERSSYLAR
jgi:hypothetical protein